jgi:DNA polymerase-1
VNLTDAYDLFHRAIPLFATMTQRGLRLDLDALDALSADVADELAAIADAQDCRAVQDYRKRFGEFKSGSGDHKRRLLFDVMGLAPLSFTDTGLPSVDAKAVRCCLEQLEEGSPERHLVGGFADEAHLVKLRGYIEGWRRLADADGYLHPSFLLHTVTSYRSSSADPNFQNVPKHNPVLARLRRCIAPRFDWLMEVDFKGAEWRGYAVNTGDAGLIGSIERGEDPHRKYAAKLLGVPEADVPGAERFNAKTGFVFPEFYGSHAKTIERNYPQWGDRVRAAEEALWAEMPDVRRWQERTYEEYRRNGRIETLTGFRLRYGRVACLTWTQCCNMGNQGFAFHRLLHCLIQIEAEMRERGMQSIMVGQIHDSGVFDVAEDELPDLVDLCERIIERPCWGLDGVVPWEAEFSVGRNFLEMEEV